MCNTGALAIGARAHAHQRPRSPESGLHVLGNKGKSRAEVCSKVLGITKFQSLFFLNLLHASFLMPCLWYNVWTFVLLRFSALSTRLGSNVDAKRAKESRLAPL